MSIEQCPCGSGRTSANCCQPILEDPTKARTAEALMRARYTAHVMKNVDFIINTTHMSVPILNKKKAVEEWVESTTWQGLEVMETQKGEEKDEEGFVLFRAWYEQYGASNIHDEYSYFKKERGIWYFVEGQTPVVKSAPVRRQKIARNALCPCGSGKKYKRCCIKS